MKIQEIKVMRGPNYWSVRRPRLIVMLLDLEEMEEFPSNKIDGFYERITTFSGAATLAPSASPKPYPN